MKIVFVSNYFNHHQKPFCEAMYRRFGADFTFIATTVMSEERKKLGYDQNDVSEYVLLSYTGEEQKKAASLLIRDADIVIAGGASDDMLSERLLSGKLTFRYTERPFKKKISCIKRAYHAFSLRKKNLFAKNIYMLCASAYAACDYASIGMYKDRMYKWGYFPYIKEYDTDELITGKNHNTLLWCGRFIDWKHPDDAIRLAGRLKADGYEFQLNIIGAGVMETELRDLAGKFDLTKNVHFLGSMSPNQVRVHMEAAGIYLITSDRQEGWGAVLNESMNSGCAVVASGDIGSAPFLIKHKENGLIYESGNIDDLYNKVKYLLDNPCEQNRLGIAAYNTVRNSWNAEIAAERLIKLAESLNRCGFCDEFEDGVCSKAEII